MFRRLFAADNFSRRHFRMHFFLGALKVKMGPDAFEWHGKDRVVQKDQFTDAFV